MFEQIRKETKLKMLKMHKSGKSKRNEMVQELGVKTDIEKIMFDELWRELVIALIQNKRNVDALIKECE